MSALKQHALSAAFPAMPEDEREALRLDIEKHGLRQPVVVFEGQVLDGWHRYQASLDSGRDPALVEYEGKDPRAFVESCNFHRRHLTAGQRAIAEVRLSEWRPVGANQHTGGSAPSAEALSERAGVSPRMIEYAKTADKAGAGDLVRDRKVSAKTGAAIGALPKKQREKAIADPEAWQAGLERKSPPPSAKDEERLEEVAANAEQAAIDAERMADLAFELEELRRVVGADDKLAEARLIIKEQRAKYEQLERLYNAQRVELATMTREAKRWQRKAEAA